MEWFKREMEKLGRRAIAVKCDVADDARVAAMKDKAIKAFGNIDILINNAAVGIRGSLEDVSLDDWRYLINTNLMGYVRNVHAFLTHFTARGTGYTANGPS